MVFQSYALYPHMNVYQNMAFGLKLRKFKKAEIDKRVREAAKILDIEHLLDRKPKAFQVVNVNVLPWDAQSFVNHKYS